MPWGLKRYQNSGGLHFPHLQLLSSAGRVAHPVNLLIAINLHERVPHPAFFWRGGVFRSGYNPPLSKLADMLAQSRHIRVAFSRLCTSKTKEATVEMNGAELCAKSDKEFLESAKARTSINFEVTVIQDGASYEITCP